MLPLGFTSSKRVSAISGLRKGADGLLGLASSYTYSSAASSRAGRIGDWPAATLAESTMNSRTRPICIILLSIVVVTVHVSRGDMSTSAFPPESPLPVGTWRVEFTNGVIEVCDICEFNGGYASVDEPLRR